MPSRGSVVWELDDAPVEAQALISGVVEAGSSVNGVSALDAWAWACDPGAVLELEGGVVDVLEAGVDSWAVGAGSVGLSELELTGDLADGLVALGDVDLLAAWDAGEEADGALAVHVGEDGLVIEFTLDDVWLIGCWLGADEELRAVGVDLAEVDWAGAAEGHAGELQRLLWAAAGLRSWHGSGHGGESGNGEVGVHLDGVDCLSCCGAVVIDGAGFDASK